MTTVVVGTGYTGLRLLKRLPAATALGLSRTPPAATTDREIRKLDLDESVTTLELPPRSRLLYTVPPATDVVHDRRLDTLVGALRTPPGRVVYLSTTGVYGDHGGAIVSEATPVAPQTTRAARRVAAERTLARFAEETGTPVVILRVPGIYGPDRLMIERVRDREPLIDDAEASPGNRIHVDDLVTACEAALCRDVPPGTYNVGDGDTRTSTWFAREVARQLGWPEPPTISLQEAEARFSPQRMSFLAESRTVDTTRMREVLGVTPGYRDAADGIHASLREMGLID